MPGLALVAGDFVRTGGMDMPNLALAERSAERGILTDLVSYRVDDDLTRNRHVRWHRVPKPLGSYLLGSPLLDALGRKHAARVSKAGGRVIVNGGNCQFGDVNWVHYVHAAYEPTLAASPLRRAKASLARRLSLAHERSALRAARLVLVNSVRTARDVERLFGVPKSRVRVVYYGIDAERFKPVDSNERTERRRRAGISGDLNVAFIGALGDRRKGFDTLYAAWRALCSEPSWDANLLVIGHGVELERWRARTAAEGLANRIQFLGFRRDVPDILAGCRALVAPTRYEAFGLGVQEALCSGVPAVVTASAGVAEHYPEGMQQLLLGDPDSSDELRTRLLAWRMQTESFERATLDLGRRLRERTWRTMADEILELVS